MVFAFQIINNRMVKSSALIVGSGDFRFSDFSSFYNFSSHCCQIFHIFFLFLFFHSALNTTINVNWSHSGKLITEINHRATTKSRIAMCAHVNEAREAINNIGGSGEARAGSANST